MTVWKRLTRKPLTTLLWLVFAALMTGFLSAAAALWYSTEKLSDSLDKSHTAIAVRSDPGSVIVRSGKDLLVSGDTRSFTMEDVEAIESLSGVKKVRIHTVAGCSSPAFHPFIDIRRELGWRSSDDSSAYYHAVFAGKLVAKDTTIARHPWYSAYQKPLYLLFELDDALLLNDEYAEPFETMQYTGGFSYLIDLSEDPDAADYFVEGEHYVVTGIYDPGSFDMGWTINLNPDQGISWAGPVYHSLVGGPVVRRDGYLEDASERTRMTEDGQIYFDDAVWPAAERFDGDADAFFASTPNDVWRTYRDAWQYHNHAMVSIGTERLETVFSFLTGEAVIIEGRSFTEEEYKTGAKVLVISEITAKLSNLHVGDTVPFSQFELPGDTMNFIKNSEHQNNPRIDGFFLDTEYTEPETFTVVGIYRLPMAWSEGTYAFTTNTVFLPRGAQIADAYPKLEPYREPTVFRRSDETVAFENEAVGMIVDGDLLYDDNNLDIYGLYLSVELQNGSVEEFQLALEDSPYCRQLFVYDQGFETVQENLNELSFSTARLLLIALGGWVLLLLLYLLMYQSAQKKNVGIMRSLGATPGAATSYLVLSGMIVATVGILIGTVLSRVVLGVVQEHVYVDMLGTIDRTAHGGALVISEEALKAMVDASTPGVRLTALCALAQFGVIGVGVWIHAAVVSRMSPRTLSEG